MYQLRIGSWSCGKSGNCSLLMFPFFSHFWDIFLSGAFLHLSVTPTSRITNDGKGCLCIYICFCLMSESARDVNFKEDFPPSFSHRCECGSSVSPLGSAAALSEGDFGSTTRCCSSECSQCVLKGAENEVNA